MKVFAYWTPAVSRPNCMPVVPMARGVSAETREGATLLVRLPDSECLHYGHLLVRENLLGLGSRRDHVAIYCYLCECVVDAHVSEIPGCLAQRIEQLIPDEIDWAQSAN